MRITEGSSKSSKTPLEDSSRTFQNHRQDSRKSRSSLSTGWIMASLAEKIPEQAVRRGLAPLRQFLDNESRGLQVQWEFSLRKNWLDVKAAGDDAEAFINVLRNRFSTIPVQLSKVEKWDLARGNVVGSGKVGFGVYVDLGIFEPVARDSLYPLHRMRAQLADGVTKPCREIIE